MNEQLKAYLDNALTPEERTKLETELQTNPALQQELEELKETSQYLEASSVPVEIKGLESTLAALSKKRAKLPWFRSPYAVLAACTVIIAMVMTTPGTVMLGGQEKSAAYAVTDMAVQIPGSVAPAESKASSSGEASESEVWTNSPQLSPGREAAKSKRETVSPGAGYPADNIARSDARAEVNKVLKPDSNTTQGIPNNRLIIKTADLSVRVKQLEPATTRTESIAKQFGGFVENSSRYNQGNSKYASYTIRVASAKFDQAMTEIRKLGEVTAESISGNDVTGQVADTAARLKQKRLEEAQYQEVLKSARRIDDILQVKQYISDIREEIEATEAQLKSLKDLASLSTITLSLEQRETIKSPPPRDWLSNSWIQAINRFSGIGQYLIGAAINVLVLAPFWLPFAIGIWWWNRKRNRGS